MWRHNFYSAEDEYYYYYGDYSWYDYYLFSGSGDAHDSSWSESDEHDSSESDEHDALHHADLDLDYKFFDINVVTCNYE